jgi:membrane-bound lytic murein transglycosylase D
MRATKLIILLFFFNNIVFANKADTIHVIYNDFPEDLSYDLVADQLTCISNKVPLNYNENVHAFINYFAVKNRSYSQEMIKRENKYFPIFERYLKKYGLPDELKYLSIVESGLNPQAISRARAAGLWQFMPATGRSFKLHQDWYIDERMDPEKSTEAACKYLKQLHRMFGDWELALAAYNSGPGNVRKAIRRSGYKKKFWEIFRYLPRETRAYLPQYVAIVYVLNHANELGFNTSQDLQYEMSYDTIMVSHYTHLHTVAAQLNLCNEELTELNPSIRRKAIPDLKTGTYPIKIPIHKYELFSTNRVSILDSAKKVGRKELEQLAKNTVGSVYGRTKITHRVRSGQVLGTIAERYQVRVSDLRKWNNLRGSMIRVGQPLKIWVKPNSTHSLAYKDHHSQEPANSRQPIKPILDLSGKKIHVVKSGDTLWDIARMYEGLSIAKIKVLNKMKTSKIKPGQKLIVG